MTNLVFKFQRLLPDSSFTVAICFIVCIGFQICVRANEKWVEVHSKNFTLVGNASEQEIRDVANKLEQFRFVISEDSPIFSVESNVPTNVIVFRDRNAFRKFKPTNNGKRKDWVAGFFQPGPEINYIVLSLDEEKSKTYQTLFHEYVHLLIKNTFKFTDVPGWLSEGLAEYYAGMEVDRENKVRKGNENVNHSRILRENRLIPAEQFFDEKYSLFETQTDEEITIFYAQSWVLVHYLVHRIDGKGNSRLQNFFSLLVRTKNIKTSFEEAFDTDYESIENELKNYIAQKSFSSTVSNLGNKLNNYGDLQVSAISPAEAKSFQGDLLYRMNRFDEAEVVLNEALSLDPNQELGNIALGLVKMQKGDFEQSRKLLKKAIAGDSKNYLAYYYHAFVLSRSTVSGRGIISHYDSNTVSVMRSDLKKSIALNPEFATAYYLYALISIVQNDEIENGLAMLEIGIKLRPEDQMFQLRKSELLMRKKDLINSRLIAEGIQKKAEDDAVREFAKNLLENIANYENRIKISDQITEANRYLPEDYEKLSAEQLAALERRIEIDSINKNLREIKVGEKRVLGRVLEVNCSKKGVMFSIRTKENVQRFVNKSFENLVFYTYQIQLKGGSIGCESNLSEYFSIITFRPADTSNQEFDGELISLEFVPEYFEFRQNAVSDQ